METTFNGDATLHAEWVAGMEAHAAADRLVQKLTGEDGRGCFIWCAAGVYDTSELHDKTGIAPRMSKLLEAIFEGLEPSEARQFAMDVTHAIPYGVVLDDAIPPFLHWLMGKLVPKTEEGGDVRKSVEQVRDLYANGWPKSQAANQAADIANELYKVLRNSGEKAWECASITTRAAWAVAAVARMKYEAGTLPQAVSEAKALGISYAAQAEALLGFIRNLNPNQ
jgi:hypothetical protein